MNQELGRRIKALRAERNMTQEALALALAVSPQAVSKWEHGVTMPDISLLPSISVAFGVTIDELFCLSDNDHMSRIDHMIGNIHDISDQEFIAAEAMLRSIAARKPGCGEAWLRLAELYESRVGTLTREAVVFAKRALQLQPEEKACHSVLTNLLHGYGADWTCANTLHMVQYYRELMQSVPSYQEGWRFLIAQLIGNGLLEEARGIVENHPQVKGHLLAKMWLGDVAYAQGDGAQALRLWQACIDESPNEWRPYAFRADRMVSTGRYDEAILDYQAWLEKQPAPPYCDPYICMALLYEELGELPKALKMRKAQLQLLREGFGFVDGDGVCAVELEIQRLQAKAAL